MKMESSQGWLALPHKDQLFILILARLSEPITQTSLQSYMYYQLKSISPTASEETLSQQAGLIQTAYTLPQICSAIIWGRLADWPGMGRKKAIISGLIGTAISVLGMGFSSTFTSLIFWRAVGGALNGNIGIMRTMISEVVGDKRNQTRAFLLLPMAGNVGIIIGPLLGSLLATPVDESSEDLKSAINHRSRHQWMRDYPYALPNVINAVFLSCAAAFLFFGLNETLLPLRGKPDFGRMIYHWIKQMIHGEPTLNYYAIIPDDEQELAEAVLHSNLDARGDAAARPEHRIKLPLRETLTRKVLSTYLLQILQAFHLGTFSTILLVFLATPRYTTESRNALGLPAGYHPSYPFVFTGGLAFAPDKIGTMLAILGFVGLPLQLIVYPRLALGLGALRSYRLASLVFPICYFAMPFLSLVQNGYLLWAAVITVLFVQTLGRVFAAPSIAILVNNSSPHPTVLGTIHGMSQSLNALSRSLGPLVLMGLYGFGLRQGIVGMAWWTMAGVALLGVACGSLLGDNTEKKALDSHGQDV